LTETESRQGIVISSGVGGAGPLRADGDQRIVNDPDVVVRTAAKLAGWYFHTGAGMLGAGFLGTIAKKSAPGTRW